jgi:hypothetical protein
VRGIPRILLHVGGEKTGTTSLQAFLTRNARTLLRRHGILYPTSGPLFLDNGHFPCVSAFIPPEQCEFVPPAHRLSPRDLAGALSALTHGSGARLIVLSAEHFSSRMQRPDIARLAAVLAPFDTEILLYARRQDELAISAFSTALLSGGRHWFDPAKVSPGARYFNYLAVADDWASEFGMNAVRVRAYNALTDGIESDFLDAVGVPPASGFDAVSRRKRKLTLAEAIVLHRVNQQLTAWGDVVQGGDVDGYYRSQRMRERVVDLVGHEASHGSSLMALLPPETRAGIMRRFADSNAELARRYGAVIPDDAQQSPSPAMAPTMDEEIELLTRTLIRGGSEIVALEGRVSALARRTTRSRLHAAASAVTGQVTRLRQRATDAIAALQARPRRPMSRNLARR